MVISLAAYVIADRSCSNLSLRDAFRVCDVGALEGEALRYYDSLEDVRSIESIRAVSVQLDFLEVGEFRSLLFTGHRGCGKSTELRKLQQSWEQNYRVIYLESDNEIDIHDADYTDLYLVLIKQISDDMARLRLRLESDRLRAFQTWFLEVTEETEESVEKSVSLETTLEAGIEVPFLSKLMTKLLAQIKGSNVQKHKIRETLQRDIGRLKRDLNALLRDAFEQVRGLDRSKYQKGFLVIFDNLDRVPPLIGDRLYFEYATQLQELACTLIYTVPISVVYSDKNLNNAFARPNIVPMVNVYQFAADRPELAFNDKAVQAMGRVLAKRIDLAAVFQDVRLVSGLVKASGGHIRQLMQMTAVACRTAAARGHEQIQQDDVTYAIKQEQFNFERVIPVHHYPPLVQVCQTKRIDQNEDGQKMLFNTSVLEYDSDRRWNYINPVVKYSDAYREALQAAIQPRATEISGAEPGTV